MKSIKETLKKIRLKINKIGSKKRKAKIINKDFSIISNNCYAGIVYQYLGLKYNTPTIGLFFFSDEYIKFLEKFNYYIKQELTFIDSKDSKYYSILKKDGIENAIIGMLKDVEIVFLHYKSREEAYEKWTKRCKRLSENLIFKFNDQNLCSYENIKKFDELPIKNKLFFSSKNYSEIKSCIWIRKYRNQNNIKEDYYSGHKYFNIIDYINRM